MNKTILVLGGDGYLGWPLSLRLSAHNPEHRVVMIDNLSRRQRVDGAGSDSLTPILDPETRIKNAGGALNLKNLEFIEADVAQKSITELIATLKPSVIYHLAQQASAGYSMSSAEKSIETAINNEQANLRILWAIREHVPNAHLIKLGSFGEYCQFGLDIAEGYFFPEYGGKKAEIAAPYPRSADDIYHVSKINDSNYISMACRQWGLKITEVMQSTVFGLMTSEIRKSPQLVTRFDYDTQFGTVLNRFMVQTLLGAPITVYGSGWQRTGLMALEDAIDSLAVMHQDDLKAGTHRVINHVGEKNLCIRDIANLVKSAGESHGLAPTISLGDADPRKEQPDSKALYRIETPWLDHKGFTPRSLAQVVNESFSVIREFRSRIRIENLKAALPW